ncbi:MAG: cyclase family protein [Gammaproteobacteria bacterium]|nr:cyclase family protein [Gammaproteobacteria bacterium]
MTRLYLLGLLACVLTSAQALDLASYRMVDLSHPYNDDTLYWPTSPSRFEKKQLAYGDTPGGWFYSAFAICTPEHGGTHLDAPRHFAALGAVTDALPLEKLIAPGVVIDVSEQAATEPDYLLNVADIEAFESAHGRIAPGTIVLLRTGWSEFWPDAKRYLGDDTPGSASNLHFPSYGAEAARFLVEKRGVALLGVDTASIDHGPSRDFIVHRIAAAENVGGLENLTNLDQLPTTGFTVFALPMKIGDGSGGPVRVVALVPRQPAL